MDCQIFYFSGTGNSLHVARELSKRIENVTLHPIVSLLDGDVVKTEANTLGIVFPVYTNTVPYQVREFLKKLDPSSAEHIFSVATHAGVVNIAFTRLYLKKALKKKGKELSYFHDLRMVINNPTGIIPSFIPVYDKWPEQITREKIEEAEKEVQEGVDVIVSNVIAKNSGLPKEKIRNRLLEKVFSRISGGTGREIKFLSDDTCISCGTCEDVCLSGKIRMGGARPIWHKDVNCFYCYACFNYCPNSSILVERWKRKDGRYHHPEVNAGDIASQKKN